jgi:CSN8/PSMD8/EIF3K family
VYVVLFLGRGFFFFVHSSILPRSEREFPIRGLNLIRLLIQNRIADFHTTLESLPLPADALVSNPFILHPVNLERWLMEGSYSKVWNAREEAPAEEYKFFVDSLMGTIRFVLSFLFFLAFDWVGFSIKNWAIYATGTRLRVAKRRRTRVYR